MSVAKWTRVPRMLAGGGKAGMQQNDLGDEPVCLLRMEKLLSGVVSWAVLRNKDLHDPP